MKKQTKLSLNKFKIAKISKFEQGEIVGGDTGVDDDQTTTRTRKDIDKNSSGDVDIHGRCNELIN